MKRKKTVLLAFVLVFLSMSMFGTPLVTTVSGSTTYQVYPGQSIQEAINNASSGDTIFVHGGTYNENVILNKPNLALVGENKHTTIIHGNGTSVVSLKANNTKITEFTLQNGYFGVWMDPWTQGHVINSNIMSNNNYGVAGHYDCFNVSINCNVITSNNISGIQMLFSQSTISSNLISNNGKGVFQPFGSGIQIVKGVNNETIHCLNNTIFGNTIENNPTGVWAIEYSEGNLFYRNNFINNTKQFSISPTTWNNSITDNYWSDYTGTDIYGGPHQNETGSDGIGDTPYDVDAENQDNHPLMGTFSDFNATSQHRVQTICNSSISDFQFNGSAISFKVSGQNGTIGFCRIHVPTALMNGTYKVFVNGTEVPYTLLPSSNSTHSYLYFTYNRSTQKVITIISELPALIPMLLVLIVLTVAIALYKRRLARTLIH